VNLTILDVSANVSAIANGSVISGNAGIAMGMNAMGATTDDSTRSAGAPRAQYTKLLYGGSFYRSFTAGGIPLTWQTLVSGQYSEEPLYGAEQIAIGSLYSVRGFQTTSLAGRSGIYARNDLGMPIPMPGWFGMDALRGQIRPYIGYDLGHINDNGSLQGWTTGLDLSFPNASLQIAYSRPIAAPESLPKEVGWLYARLTLTY
jgi:hemolysin activation/secretion protein